MKKPLNCLLAFLLVFGALGLQANPKNPPSDANSDGGNLEHDENDSEDSDGKEKNDEGPADDASDNCSVVFEVNAGSFAHELGQRDVYLRIKRLKPTPLLFTPESLAFDSLLASTVFQAPPSDEAQAVEEAELNLEAAQLNLSDVQADEATAQATKVQAETELVSRTVERNDAQAALDNDPGNPALQEALTSAEAALGASERTLAQAISYSDAMLEELATAQQALADAKATLNQAQDTLQQQIDALTAAGSLVTDAQGLPIKEIS